MGHAVTRTQKIDSDATVQGLSVTKSLSCGLENKRLPVEKSDFLPPPDHSIRNVSLNSSARSSPARTNPSPPPHTPHASPSAPGCGR